MGNENFLRFLEERKKEYNSWSPVYCEVIGDYIHFTARGFNHLRFKIDNTPRNPKEVMYKAGLLPLVRPVIYGAKKFRYEKRISPIGGTRRKVLKKMDYWAMIEIVGKRDAKIKVIVRRIGNGKIHFWSVMKLGENKNTP